MDGPDVIRWLIQLGMQFDLEDEQPASAASCCARSRAARRPRGILSYRDYTGLEMMRVLREAVELEPGIDVLEPLPGASSCCPTSAAAAPARCSTTSSGAASCWCAPRAVILATGGAGRLHLNRFPTSNHYGATADGLVLAYRIGARLRELDCFQYHPTGIA